MGGRTWAEGPRPQGEDRDKDNPQPALRSLGFPLGKGVRYRVVTRGGKKIRLAYKGKSTVVEAKNLSSGATHTPEEFASDRRKKEKKEGKG